MNEPLFTLDNGADGARRFADPTGRDPAWDSRPPLLPLRVRLLAGTFRIAAAFGRRRPSLRT